MSNEHTLPPTSWYLYYYSERQKKHCFFVGAAVGSVGGQLGMYPVFSETGDDSQIFDKYDDALKGKEFCNKSGYSKVEIIPLDNKQVFTFDASKLTAPTTPEATGG